MSTTRMSQAGLGFIVWLAAGLSVAQAADILPVATPPNVIPVWPYGLKPSRVTLEIRDLAGAVITDQFLPEPNQTVRLVVKIDGVVQSPPPPIALVNPPASPSVTGTTNPFINTTTLTTSAYRGRCTNVDNIPGLPALDINAPDVEQDSVNRDLLKFTDCGGFAVVKVTALGGDFTFIVPPDSNANGIPDSWEAQFCNTVPCPTGAEDGDLRPTASALLGDNASALDEYRGYMIPGNTGYVIPGTTGISHIRTDPRQVDLFIYLVNPQCTGEPAGFPSPTAQLKSRLGGGTLTYPTAGNGALFDGLSTLYGQTQMHFMHLPGAANYKSTQFVDKFLRYEVSVGQRYDAGGGVETGTPPADDRQINKNAVLSGNQVQKVVRVIECIVPPPPATPLGLAGTISLDASGYAILYTYRIISNIQSLVAAGAGRTLRFSTYQGGRATSPQVIGAPTLEANVNFMISQWMKFGATHEVLHTGNLVPPGGTHDPVGTGNFLDSAIITKVDSKTLGFNTFYIPTLPDSVTSLYKTDYLIE